MNSVRGVGVSQELQFRVQKRGAAEEECRPMQPMQCRLLWLHKAKVCSQQLPAIPLQTKPNRTKPTP